MVSFYFLKQKTVCFILEKSPIVLAFHGTGVKARNMCDSFKIMLKNSKDYKFGFEKSWLLCPSRFGAHNWEQSGFRTAFASIQVRFSFFFKDLYPA